MEFKSDDLAGALDAYERASAVAKTLPEKCEARLSVARVYSKRQQAKEARNVYRSMIKDCGDAADPFEMRYGLYAAERLITAFNDADSARVYVAGMANRWLSRPELFLVRSLLPAEDSMNPQETRMERVLSLAGEYARVNSLARAGWVAYGKPTWLIRESNSAGTAPLLFVVSAEDLAPPLARFVSEETSESVPLGRGFSGLRVEWLPGRFPPPNETPASLYIAALAFMIGATVLGGYLLLRDVNRDLRTAELRTHFVASVSHELKTPLTAVRMFAETLMLGRVPDERTRTEYLATITNESERLTRLVDNVLDFSKIEQGKKAYHMKPTALADVVRSAARAMQYPLAQSGFSLNVSIDDQLPAIDADADALQQAILNLLSNAMKYSGRASPIELRLAREDGEAIIQVTDHGIGIPQEEQPRIFEKFYRVRSPQTEAVGGTGLGLTLVKHIVEAHRGRVDLRSEVGHGSTFAIRLPL
jgi:signal transduction histidine kinase